MKTSRLLTPGIVALFLAVAPPSLASEGAPLSDTSDAPAASRIDESVAMTRNLSAVAAGLIAAALAIGMHRIRRYGNGLERRFVEISD